MLRKRLADLEESVEKARISFSLNNLTGASHDLWKINVDLETLNEKVKVLQKR